MSKSKFVKYSIVLILAILSILIVCVVGVILHWAENTEVKIVHKTYVDFIVAPGQIVDYQSFIIITDENEQLNEIDPEIRQQISDYMKENNLKLQEGHHYFNRIDGTYAEYIQDNFKFEKIK